MFKWKKTSKSVKNMINVFDIKLPGTMNSSTNLLNSISSGIKTIYFDVDKFMYIEKFTKLIF